ncbi:MAG: thioredoxin family protein [Crocinitomicaceae bacterium]|jgi:thioredoxin-related protein
MKTICSILIAVLVSLQSFAQIKKGTVLPLSDQQMLDVKTNSKMALKDYKKEKGLLVIFSCNTCPFVVGTPDFPGWERQYNRLFEQATKQNIGFILVNSNEAKRGKEDSIEEMIKRAEDQGYKMPYLVDENSSLANAFGAKTTPHIFLFNGDLKLVYSGSIDNIWDNKRTEEIPYLANAMDALSQGKKIKPSATPPKGCSIKRKTN